MVERPCKSYHLCLFFSFFLLFLHAKQIQSQSHQCNPNDLKSLQSFYRALKQTPRALNWSIDNSSSNCCEWTGVTCDSARVIGLDLSNRSLKGSITNELSGLDQLIQLNLSINLLSGVVPSSLFRLSQLELLDLSLNSLSGEIPSVPSLPSIQVFNISFNSFNGTHPILPNSPNLQKFDITSNSFSGEINTGTCNHLVSVQILRFSMNKFSGNFPTGFGNCSSLTELSLDTNRLTGTLPDDLFKLSNLTKLSLQGNSLSDTLNPSLTNLSSLLEIDLCSNNFSGFIPDVFGNLTKLESFCVQSNNFSGLLPPSLSNCKSLRVLSLRNNTLTGPISLNFSALAKLNMLDLGSNQFNGSIPSNLPLCSQMKALNLARNNLLGEIPSSFANFTSLNYLSLTGNNFSNVSLALQTLQNLPNLTTLVLTKNFHGGETIPFEGILGFHNIEVFVLANCLLSGSIPPWISTLTKLNILDISWNHLSGTIPPWIGNLEHLFYLDISNNSLTGEIPASLTQMRSFVASNSSKQGASMEELPFFVKRNSTAKPLQYNQISTFPPSIILCYNFLVGPILPGFGNLTRLHMLDLSYNNLSGPIPEELSDMSSLETLVLSHNDLNGTIPNSLTKLNFLSRFDVSYNNLTGQVPTGGQFSTFSSENFIGNPSLCGSPHLPPCLQKDENVLQTTKNKNKGVIIGPAIGIGIGIATFLTVFYLVVSRVQSRRQDRNPNPKAVANAEDSSSEPGESRLVLLFHNKDPSKDLTIEDIIKSTDNFDQSYIVGCGGFGLVYKATLPCGKKVAIKKLSGDYCQIDREFRAEVETLSRVQHKNLVSLQGYCKVGMDRLLIYSFMENGSLDYWLHEKPDGPRQLDWSKRLNIARGAARGLSYLHQSCDPHILHRDIKSSNILLDTDFEARLADFGLARLILSHDTHVTTDVVGTLGYIPPEYAASPVATFKGDVYSFGVVLLELVTGHRPVDMCRPKESRDMVSWVVRMRAERREREVVDLNLNLNGEREKEVLRVLEIACLCVVEAPKLRPLSWQLVAWLDEIGLGE